MTNLEKYSYEIAKIACSGELFSVQRNNKKPISCNSAICLKCLFYDSRLDDNCSRIKRSQWAKSECD